MMTKSLFSGTASYTKQVLNFFKVQSVHPMEFIVFIWKEHVIKCE